MKFYVFDANYVQRLKDGDPETENHFATYFGELLYLKLRTRPLTRNFIEDICQETLLRVLVSLRKNGIRKPDRLGAFVSAFCERIQKEVLRAASRHDPITDQTEEPVDRSAEADRPYHDSETRRLVRRIFIRLPKNDQSILRSFYLEELTNEEMQARFQKTAAYIRMRRFRAKRNFLKVYAEMFPEPVPTLRSLRERAATGHPRPLTQLALAYLDGIRVEADPHKAFRLLALAVARGFAPAEYHLGRIHELGLGLPADIIEAMRLYTAAGQKGEFAAQCRLGWIYATGAGVPVDVSLAKHWYGLAAEQEEFVGDCPEVRESKDYLRRFNGASA